jgi:hypothetical protein
VSESEGKVKFPSTITNHDEKVKIYGRSEGFPYYRIAYKAAGKRRVQAFSTYSAALSAAEKKAEELAKGKASIALTNKEAVAALAVRDALEAFRLETGRRVSALEAVQGFLDAARLLPDGHNLREAVKAFAQTKATIKPKLIKDAVEEFLTIRMPRAQAKDGKRSQLSPDYNAHIETWLREFAGMFPGHRLADLNREFLSKWIGRFGELSAKSRNDRRAAVAMFFRWCQRRIICRRTIGCCKPMRWRGRSWTPLLRTSTVPTN